MRLHLSLHLSFPGLAAQFARPEMYERVRSGVWEVLEQAMLMSEEGGTARGFKSVILGVLVSFIEATSRLARVAWTVWLRQADQHTERSFRPN